MAVVGNMKGAIHKAVYLRLDFKKASPFHPRILPGWRATIARQLFEPITN